MKKRIFFDGLNLALPQGTGIATYTRVLIQLAQQQGNETGILYSSNRAPSKNPLLREIGFFDERRMTGAPAFRDKFDFAAGLLRCNFAVHPLRLDTSGVVIRRQFEHRLPNADHQFLARNVFGLAQMRFDIRGDFLPVKFEVPPDIMHCTYQMPLMAAGACNIVTIHDLVPLRLPFSTLDGKRRTFRLLRKVAAKADHIVTVSENSRRDIIQILGVDERRVTNTYEAISFPSDYLARPEVAVRDHLSGSFGLEYGDYLLFFGAFEPKKNIGRIVDAYMNSGVDIPLVIVASQGWGNQAETQLLDQIREKQRDSDKAGKVLKRRVFRFEYVSRSMLVSLIRGARAVLFPSLYEGFGLPVLEAMALGTPVVTAGTSSLLEVAGDAALLVDPYDLNDIARAITAITEDEGLRADLIQRGLRQAEKFSLENYAERLDNLYNKLA